MAQVFYAISENSLDIANSSMAEFIPLVFLAMHATVAEEGNVYIYMYIYLCMYVAADVHVYICKDFEAHCFR